jgi:hypothetical protein
LRNEKAPRVLSGSVTSFGDEETEVALVDALEWRPE